METIKRSVVARGWGEGGVNRWSAGDFQADSILYDAVMVDM